MSLPPLHQPVFSGKAVPDTASTRYVDPVHGHDDDPGTKEKPWRTIQRSLPRLVPGATLCLRGGTYYENLYCSVVGTKEAPITICGYPGETVVIDGGFSEFQTDPASAWDPGEAPGEFVSRKAYPNIRDVLGLFGDSNVGLQTYWHLDHLLTSQEIIRKDPGSEKTGPYYAGPGLFYDKPSGKIHIRLAHTGLTAPGFKNYQGETDPRKLPLVVAPFRSVPLHLDQAMHVRFRDLVIRGGGYNTVLMNFAVDVEFEYVTIFGGTYCIRSKNSGPVKIFHCGIYGQIPPWGFRTENALHTYDHIYYDPFTQPPVPRDARNVARLPTHALLVTEGGEESDVFYYPVNNHWEVAYTEFADAHDGIYLNGRNVWMHHCSIRNIQDDGVYLSSPTPGVCDDVHIAQNFISKCLIPFAAHTRGGPGGAVHVYGNVVDMREKVNYRRPTEDKPEGGFISSVFFLIHGRTQLRGIENIGFYHNTAILTHRAFAGTAPGRNHPDSVRSVYNNLFVYLETPDLPKGEATSQVNVDGNLHWSPLGYGKNGTGADWLKGVQESAHSQGNTGQWQGTVWEKSGVADDPRFAKFDSLDPASSIDYRLKPESPAIGKAIDFPQKADLRGNAAGPNIGAFQNNELLRVGIGGRIIAGEGVATGSQER